MTPIHFSGSTNFFGHKNEFTNHQFETGVLESPSMSFIPLSNHQSVVKPRSSWLNFYEGSDGTIPVSEFVNFAERGKLSVESRESRDSAGNTCLSVVHRPTNGKTLKQLGEYSQHSLVEPLPERFHQTMLRIFPQLL